MPVTGMCGGVFIPVAVVPLWQLEQLVSVDAWVYLPPAQLANAEAALVWQVSQSRAIGRDMARERRRALRARGAFAGERAVVAGVAAAGADRRVTGHAHRVGRKTRRRIDVAVAALNARHRNMRRRLQAGRGGAVVAARAVGVGGRVGVFAARPAGEGRGRAGVAGLTVAAIGCDVARERRGTDARPSFPRR